jgi:hypothetical protein
MARSYLATLLLMTPSISTPSAPAEAGSPRRRDGEWRVEVEVEVE